VAKNISHSQAYLCPMVHAFFLSGMLLLHPFYVSVVDINHNQTEKTLEVSIRVFTDDFENTLKMRFPGRKVDLFSESSRASSDSLMHQYIREKLRITVNGRALNWSYLGSERVEESTWCYFEAAGVESVKKMQISNRMLYEYKKEQINMHHAVVNGERKSYKLDNPATEVVFNFE
jgi:hypothetical protein